MRDIQRNMFANQFEEEDPYPGVQVTAIMDPTG
jgi:hypothetical protein